MSAKVAVVGASGFVGATVVERILDTGNFDVSPLIHSSGNAWRLARRVIELRTVDLLDAVSLAAAMRGCTHVVNCSRGSDDVMLRGLKNLITVSKEMKIARFVHLSSVAVYGDPPPIASICEDAPTQPKKGSYGSIKLMQDEMVRNAANEGLPAIILCPPNISGPHSYFLLSVLAALKEDTLVFAGEGESACNLVDVDNLAYAVQLALASDIADGRRLFVTDDNDVTWRELVAALNPLASPDLKIRSVSKDWLAHEWTRANLKPRINPLRSLAHLVSGEVRQAIRLDPLWSQVDSFARGLVTKLGHSMEERIRLAVAGPIPVAKISDAAPINVQLSAQQLRGVRHSCDRAKRDIGYRPVHDFHQSMNMFCQWHRQAQGLDGEFADLIQQLD